ncbi:MBL fold metallo-hydrolase [Syntrophobacter fumaroxidans]|nr:MBL fold metallo-hydrolase [Syntrophobacter fumaroxidans]
MEGLHAFMWNSMSANNCNTYLIDAGARVLIDPGHLTLFEHVNAGLKELDLGPGDIDLILSTHVHPDHVEAVKWFNGTPALFAVNEEDWRLFREMAISLGAGMDVEAYVPDFFLAEGELDVKGLKLEIIHTPGHSPGSVSIYWRERKVLFTGDVIFKEGLGRTDLPGGNGELLKRSIKRLSEFDAEWMLAGHGDVVAGAERVRRNFENVARYWFNFI